MNRIQLLVASILLSVLAACGGGGGGGGAATPAAAQVSPPPLAPIIIATFGDSTDAGVVPVIPTVYSPPATTAQAELRAATGRDITVLSYGAAGAAAWDLLSGTDGSGTPFGARVRASGARIATISFGINDRMAPIENYRANLLQLVQQGQAAGVVMVLQTPQPTIHGTVAADLYPREEGEFIQATIDIARQTGATLCDQYAAIKADGRANFANEPDGVHGTPDLYAFKGRVLAGCLLPLLR